jgi:deazaflavin-dependent oxidoreductase (nitroreductase family)
MLTWLLRAPVALYSVRAGWLLGHRFLFLRHRGRKSHRLYCTVLEVLAWRQAAREAVVMSGFGPSSQWCRNVLAGQAVEVQIARLRFVPSVRLLGIDEAVGVLADYERRNRLVAPLVRAVLSKLAGFDYDSSDAARCRLVQALPLVAFRPHADERMHGGRPSQNCRSENSPALLASRIPSVVRRYSRANGRFWVSNSGSWWCAVIWAMVWSARAGDPSDSTTGAANATTIVILRSIASSQQTSETARSSSRPLPAEETIS